MKILILLFLLILIPFILAEPPYTNGTNCDNQDICKRSSDFNIFEEVIDLNGNLVDTTLLTTDCNLTVKSQSGSIVINNQQMSQDPIIPGFFYFTTNQTIVGHYVGAMNCKVGDKNGTENIAFDIIDKNVSGLILDVNKNLNDINGNLTRYLIDINSRSWVSASDIWNFGTRTLTDYNQSLMFSYLRDLNVMVRDINIFMPDLNRITSDGNRFAFLAYLAASDANAFGRDNNASNYNGLWVEVATSQYRVTTDNLMTIIVRVEDSNGQLIAPNTLTVTIYDNSLSTSHSFGFSQASSIQTGVYAFVWDMGSTFKTSTYSIVASATYNSKTGSNVTAFRAYGYGPVSIIIEDMSENIKKGGFVDFTVGFTNQSLSQQNYEFKYWIEQNEWVVAEGESTVFLTEKNSNGESQKVSRRLKLPSDVDPDLAVLYVKVFLIDEEKDSIVALKSFPIQPNDLEKTTEDVSAVSGLSALNLDINGQNYSIPLGLILVLMIVIYVAYNWGDWFGSKKKSKVQG